MKFFGINRSKLKDSDTKVRGSPSQNVGGPGATSVDGNMAVFRVTVPEGVNPGQEFQVSAGGRIVRVRCPPNTSPGQSLQITVPVDPTGSANSAGGSVGSSDHLRSDLPPDSPNVSRIEEQSNGPAAYMVTILEGVRGGQQFPVTIQGQLLMVTCPINARPGMKVRIVPPPPPADITQRPEPFRNSNTPPPLLKKDDQTRLFEVQVPEGVTPGNPFALLAGGVRVLVTCPINATPGQRIRFKLPLALTERKNQGMPLNEFAAIKLRYDKDGWTRTIRVSDMKFQWVRMDDKGDVDTNTRFDADKSAYVRQIQFRQGQDSRVRDGTISLVPANEAVVGSSIKGQGDRDLVTYADIADAQVKGYEDKALWFQEKCSMLCVEWNEGHMRMNVRREFLLMDSVDAVMSLSRKDLRKQWRFEFIGEAGIDAGGLAREWFELVTKEIFDPDVGLWQSSETNQQCMQIKPALSKFA
jgi:hypothetical protein